MKLHRQGAVWALALCAAFPFCGTLVHAQPYPTKPVRLIVGFAPGGTADIVARIVGPKLSEVWGKSVIVDNRPGAGSTLGAELAAKASPDGHTLLFVLGCIKISATIRSNRLTR